MIKTCEDTNHIVLIDDDKNIVTSVKIALENEGWQVTACFDGESGLSTVQKVNPDLVILDIKMPRMDGIEVLQKLRKISDVPVIFMTSKDDEIDEIIGLKMGADDYVTKPFSQRLLIARIQTLLRRQSYRATQGEKSSANKKVLHYGDLMLDGERYVCTWKGAPVEMTVTEFLLLQALASRPGHVKNRDQLIEAAYGQKIYVEERTIDSHIKRVRKKMRKIDNDFDMIETLYGIGYKYKELSSAKSESH